jgi:hypothetical protein
MKAKHNQRFERTPGKSRWRYAVPSVAGAAQAQRYVATKKVPMSTLDIVMMILLVAGVGYGLIQARNVRVITKQLSEAYGQIQEHRVANDKLQSDLWELRNRVAYLNSLPNERKVRTNEASRKVAAMLVGVQALCELAKGYTGYGDSADETAKFEGFVEEAINLAAASRDDFGQSAALHRIIRVYVVAGMEAEARNLLRWVRDPGIHEQVTVDLPQLAT